MAASLQKTTLFSTLRPRSQMAAEPRVSHIPRRGYHVDLGDREKALLEEDPALKRFKSCKNSVKRASKIGNALTVLVLAACSYELFAVATMKD
ncbi:succinate dehydrogenase subunit 7, mitochondrial-like [Typha latifolia]|uniref:succinate dehydrogenase subunit 7, mitochondrial-like n=1 Tax=Typha latifolia TaxID=4733 RepID=UPI003C2ABED3